MVAPLTLIIYASLYHIRLSNSSTSMVVKFVGSFILIVSNFFGTFELIAGMACVVFCLTFCLHTPLVKAIWYRNHNINQHEQIQSLSVSDCFILIVSCTVRYFYLFKFYYCVQMIMKIISDRNASIFTVDTVVTCRFKFMCPWQPSPLFQRL